MNSFSLKTELGDLSPEEVAEVERIAKKVLPALIAASRRADRGGIAGLVEPDAIADRAFAHGLAHVRERRAYRAGKAGAADASIGFAPAPAIKAAR